MKVRPTGEKGSLIVIKENGKIKMKEVFKDYGTLWKIELEPAKVNFKTILGSDWLKPTTNHPGLKTLNLAYVTLDIS